jgi:activating signal cointegrator 1
MKALTVCQPYAELIARGEKRIENRTWPTSYRGPLFIHAGKSKAWLDQERRFPGMAFGALVATAQLVACLRLDGAWPIKWRHLQDDEHANGPWCWILDDVQRIEPFEMRGAQGLWEVATWAARIALEAR